MSYRFNVLIQKEDDLYVAVCVDNNVASQGKSIEEAIENLKEALELYYEEEPPVQPSFVMMTTLEVAI